tara:strand:- start:9589 stop:12177 length:2589 start_codon:yes stop_codon:yes gene_type:complete
MSKITSVVPKVDLNIKPVPDENKILANDINEIVLVVNGNDDLDTKNGGYTGTTQDLKSDVDSQTNILTTNKTDKGAYAGTTQDLKDELDTAVFGGGKTYQTKAEQDLDTPIPAENTPSKIANDPNPLLNGSWAVSSGAWVQNNSVVSQIIDSEDIKTSGNSLLVNDRVKSASNELGYYRIRSGFNWGAIPVGYANCVLEIMHSFDLGGITVNIPSNVTLKFNGGKFLNGTLSGDKTNIDAEAVQILDVDMVLSGTWDLVESYPQWFGAVGDGSTDDSVSFQKTLNTFKNIYILDNTYLVNQLTCGNDITISGTGTLISDSVVTSNFVLSISGATPTQISSLAVNTVYGDQSITLDSVESLVDGDVLMILNPTDYSFNGARANYRAGELLEVSFINGAIVNLHNSVVSPSVTTEVLVYKMNNIKASISGIKIIASDASNAGGVSVDYVQNSVFKDLKINGGENSGFSIGHSYKCNIDKIDTKNNFSKLASSGLNYGIAIGNSQDINVTNSFLYGYRHGLTTGGGNDFAIPCRFINVLNCKSYSVTLQSLDMHGNSEFFTYSNNTVQHGIVIGGDNHIVSNNTILGEVENGSSILFSENIGFNVHVFGNTIKSIVTTPLNSRGSAIDVTDFTYLKRDSVLKIENNIISAIDSSASAPLVYIYQTLASVNSVYIMDVLISNNSFETSDGAGTIDIRNLKPLLPINSVNISNNLFKNSYIDISGEAKNIDIKNNSILKSKLEGISVNGMESDYVNISNNILKKVNKGGIAVFGKTDVNSIKLLNIVNNIITDSCIVTTGSSATNSSFLITNTTQTKLFNNFTGSPASTQQNNYFVSVTTDFYVGSNVIVTGSTAAKVDTATTTTII